MNGIVKLLISFAIMLAGGIPLWIWLGCYYFLSPTGFWEKLVMFGLGAWALGGIQLIFMIFAVAMIAMIWNER